MDSPNQEHRERRQADGPTADGAAPGTKQTPLTRAFATIRNLQRRLDEQQANQPIAVVGVGLRLPGSIDGLDSYWTALAEGRDLVRPMPASRKGPFAREWEGLPQRGGFLDEVLDFDADFFGISPREARHLDPQHRMLLEVTWEALENAALPADGLAGTSTGLYLGIMWQDYRDWLTGEPDAYWTTGNGHNFAAGRIAYALGLNGPAMSVDTACSSSLVAVHLAVQALRRGECETAFAAGANLIMSPRSMRLVQETRSLSPDGLCRTFDARAAGFTRGEGCGAVVLKRLDHALRDGDRVHAVIRGSALNQDGRSGGFTAPNVLSQVSLIETALSTAGLEPSDIGYVEAHGTGTPLGDPIEMEALATALGRRNDGAPLPVGAVKTNFGHLESAAGIAGLVKAALCLRQRRIPPVVHFRTLNPRIDLSGTGITVPTALEEWPEGAGDHAAVSSFGMSGTNAHVILGLPTDEERAAHEQPRPDAPVREFELSARTPQALRALASACAERLDVLADTDYAAFAHTAGAGRARLEVRARVVAGEPRSAAAALRALASGTPAPDVSVADTADGDARAERPGGDLPRRVIDLPGYPWQRRRYAPEGIEKSAVERPDAEPIHRHHLVWEKAELPAAAAAGAMAPDLVLAGDDAPLLTGLVREAAARGACGTVLVPPDTVLPETTDWERAPLPADRDEWRAFWATRAGTGVSRLVLALKATVFPDEDEIRSRTQAATDTNTAADTATDTDTETKVGNGSRTGGASRSDKAGQPSVPGAELCAAVTAAVTAAAESPVAESTGAPAALVYAVTRAARRTGPADRVAATDHGALHGLAPVLGLELPAAWGGVVDLPHAPTRDDLGVLLTLTATRTPQADGAQPRIMEDLAAVRDGRVLGARLRPEPLPDITGLPVRPDATYVVTGGLGAVGRELSAELVRRGARHLLLIGRRDEDALGRQAADALAELRRCAGRVVYRGGGCDTPAALAAACAPLDELPPVRGVIHAAGTVERRPAARTGATLFGRALRDKAAGAWWLHRAARDWDVDFFVLVSSVSAVWGTDQCAAYAAANGSLDALAAHRVSRGLPAVSVAYGPWALDGQGMADGAARDQYARLGVGALDAEAGRALLAARPAADSGHVVACPLDLPRFRQLMSALRPRGLTSVPEAAGERSDRATSSEPVVVHQLAELPERARADAAGTHVARILADILGHDDERSVRRDTGFFDLGLDSIAAVDLVARLSAAFVTPLLPADVFDHPTVTELAAFLLTRSESGTGPAAPGGPVHEPTGAKRRRRPVPEADAQPARVPAAVPEAAQLADDGALDDEAPEDGTPDAGEPVAIVGMAGRFPGADSVDELWDLLREGRDGVGTMPRERREALHVRDDGPVTSDQGGYLRDIDRFDADFFGIPAREAQNLDPQQRLLLESAWHALEDGGIDPRRIKDTRTGVFVGVSYADYARLLAQGGTDRLDAYYGTGTALNAAAGRLAYVLGLTGPALAVDTACSSSLVALHLGIRSLRSGESDIVLAGGVNVILDQTASIAVSRAHMLSPDGRCRTFAADANGFVRSEGCGVLVLKRLADAQRDGDSVLAVVRGSAVNQDGASSGLTAPSGAAQEAMLTAALADAGTDGAEISYLEAHGTGTTLGDPIEIGAAWRVLGRDRKPGAPLKIGSVKSNIGHCESAAGMAAVIKTVLALRHGLLPANLHFSEPNPHIDWASMNLRVVESPTPWRASAEPRVAGVSGFGFTGTNAHVILAEAPTLAPDVDQDSAPGTVTETADAPQAARPLCLLPLSAPDAAGLDRLSSVWRHRIERAAPGELPGLARTAGVGRAHFPHRRALLGRDRDQLLAGLDTPAPAPRHGGGPPRVAFLFSGQGSQYAGMGRELYETEPVFRSAYDSCDRVLAPLLGASLTDLVLYADDRTAVHETRITQPALVSLEYALAALWESWGVRPDAVLGHSVGEISAALCASVMDLETGLALIADRARLMQATERGAMLALVAPEQDAAAWAAEAGLDLAAVNGPKATVVSGAPDAVAALEKRLTGLGVRHRRLSVSHAFHSALLDPALDDFSAALAPLEFGPPAVPLVSNVTGRPVGPDELDAAYWREHARRPVRFLDGARELAALDVDVCLEIGPDRTLVNLVKAAGVASFDGTAFSLRRGAPGGDTMLTAAAKLYELGRDLDWRRVGTPARGRSAGRLTAPLYPFADTRHWTPAAAAVPAPATAAGTGEGPPWGVPLRSPALRGRVYATRRGTDYPAHLTDHRLFGVVSVPGASQTATALSALGSGGTPIALEDLHFPRALVLRDGERYDLQIIEAEQAHGARTVSVQSLVDVGRGRWQEHLAARVVDPGATGTAPPPDTRAFVANASIHVDGERFYAHLHALGYHLGTSFRWIQEVWIDGDEAVVRFAEPERMNESPDGYEIHPGLLDSLLQSTVAFAVAQTAPGSVTEETSLAIPFAAARVDFPGRPPRGPGSELWGHVRVVRDAHAHRPADFHAIGSADLRLFDSTGETVLAVEEFRFRSAPRALLERSLRERTAHAYEMTTEPVTVREPTGRHRIAVAGADQPPIKLLVRAFEQLGHRVTTVDAPELLTADPDLIVDTRFVMPPGGPGAGSPPEAVLGCAAALARTLRETPRHIPYAVMSAAPPPGAPGPDPAAPLRDALWGLLASLEAEQRDRSLLRVTSRAGTGPDTVARVLTGALEAGFPEPRVEIDAEGFAAVRLVPRDEPVPDGAPDGVAGAAALITGGLGALGLCTARVLAGWGASAVTLMSRSEPDAVARHVIDELTAGGTAVQVVPGDVTDPEDCRRAVTEAARRAPLRLVLHLAGTTDDRAFGHLDEQAFATVFAAKAAGAARLADALRDQGRTEDLTAFVLYSSVSAVLGSAGQANYAAANGYLNGLARTLRASGLPATSVSWGPWQPATKGGLAGSDATRRAIGRLGISPLDDEAAAGLLHLAVAGEAPHLVAVAVDTAQYERAAGPARAALLRGTSPVPEREADGEPRGWLREDLQGLDAEVADERLRTAVREFAAEVLGERFEAEDDLGFGDLGLDSIMVIDLRTRLSHALATDLPATVALDHPTVALLAAYLANVVTRTGQEPEPAVPGTPAPEPALSPAADPAALSFDELVQAVQADLTREK
ncbi:SDR family NAD(P)-dependent oxidoreductase [Streptomyces sp. NPDC058818]|uniref:SDR family NAD(P)-dependent oxidoreductase n=1 Tax=Streptomyces sp. NPDC058818 TaxID=3346640 RepID=UPI0036A8D765